ncbi:unnamed protein product [Ranitomeya imitator]|uniref:Uncharacterized protein n=1 Tax=Ranitomeya imitator TaxID=111125 RepID=A0ABN9MKU1_9NEOB|nr:unnamed protein product [Ranitomeya imitator]
MDIQDNDSLRETLQELEEFPQQVCSPREEEKELTEALVEISEKILEDDHKSIEWLIGTGWDEAARGWGPVSAMACLHLQKKQKKPKAGEATDCILCLDLCFIPESKDTTAETKPGTVTNHEKKSATQTNSADHGLAAAEKDLASGFTGHCPSTETAHDKVSSVEVSTREPRPNKEKNIQRNSSPITGKAFPLWTDCYNTKESPTFNVPLLLPPLKASPGNGHAEQMARRKEVLLHHMEKLPSKGFMGSTLAGQVLHNMDLRVEKKLLEVISNLPKEQLRVPQPLSFVTSYVPKIPAKDVDRLHWQNSLLVQKSLGVNASNVKHETSSAQVGFLHTRTMQNKRNMRQESRPLNDTKGRRAKSGGSPVIVLPSLTVTRVEIPVKIKMC